ncbi:MAG TPA: translocation/assembly module TamB, partial [Luteimonas sp.]|nr:translocation/assembly module TamB [Luteimonas sp.]
MADPRAVPPEEHERRIAELRKRRRQRLRVLAWRSAFFAVGIALLVAVLLSWLLTTVGGRDVLLRQIVQRLPPGATLTWDRATGPAAGPMTLRGVRFTLPRQRDPACVPGDGATCEMGTLVFTADTLVVDPALRPLLGRRLRLDALVVQDATLDLPRSDTPFELPRWPESLPDIAPPLALQADAVVVDRFAVTREGEPLLDIARARGGIDASDGALHLEHVVVDSNRGRFGAHGDYAPGDDFRMDLTATAVLPAPAGRTRPNLGLVARGDLSHLVVALAGNAPAPLDARLVLDDDSGGERPRWRLQAGSEALDPALLSGSGEPGTPIAFALRARGVSGDMRAQGRYAQGNVSVVLQPSRLVLDDQVLAVQPLVLDMLGGRVTARGHVDLHQTIAARREPDVDLELQARGLEWRGDGAGAAQVAGDADVRVAGSTDDWTATGSADLRRDGQRARLRFEGRGDREQVVIRALHAAMPTGTLDASGQLRWSPALAWQADARLAGFDPGYLLPDWDGAVDGRVASRGSTRGDGGLDLHFDVRDLGGRLRGRPIDGHGTLAIRTPGPRGGPPAYEGEV